MKMLKTIAILLAVLLVASFASADTFRLGGDRFTFNPTNTVTKTAAYTLTSSDSQVKVTCSSANIVITLPTISSVTTKGTKTYKILKTDATTYKVVVTPATGDTIGGESTRYIVSQNAYVIISTGPNNDWSVDFESPYIVEDHEAGTVTFEGIGTYTTDTTFGGTTPAVTIGDAGAEDAQLNYDGNAVDFSIGLDDSVDLLTISKGTALGTTNILTFANTPTSIIVHDASAADATVTFDGNAVDFGLGLDDSADKFVIGKDGVLGTTPILAIHNTPTNIVIHDATAADATLTIDGNAVDFSFGLDDSADAFALSKGTALGTTNILSIANTPTAITVHDASAADATIALDGNAQDFYVCLDDSADDLVIGLGSACGTTPAISIAEDTSVKLTDILILEHSDAPIACAAGTEGAIYYDLTSNVVCYCDGSAYKQVADGSTACQ